MRHLLVLTSTYFMLLFAFSMFRLITLVASQETGWKRLHNDLVCVKWEVKVNWTQSINQSINQSTLLACSDALISRPWFDRWPLVLSNCLTPQPAQLRPTLLLIDRVKVSHHTQRRIGHFGDALPSQYLGLVLRKTYALIVSFNYRNTLI